MNTSELHPHAITRTAPQLCDICEDFVKNKSSYATRRYEGRGTSEYHMRSDCYLCLSFSNICKLFYALDLTNLDIGVRRGRSLWLERGQHAGHLLEEVEVYLDESFDGTTPASVSSTDIWQALTISMNELLVLPYPKRAIEFVREILLRCLETHRLCASSQTPASAMYPSRVLSIGSSTGDRCSIVDYDPNAEWSYAALSYCWGTSDFIQSNRRTFAQHSIGFPSALPRAFQDAVFLCQTMGIPYLWIDSLCILQDDPHDWAIESAKMAGIYREAIIVIGAATIKDPSCSFLNPVEEAVHEALEIEPEDVKAQLPIVRARRRLANSGWQVRLLPFGECVHQPLHARGWAFQERLLATRYVHFTKEEIQWECDSLDICECGSDVRVVRNADARTVLHWKLAPFKAWDSAVDSYTTRSLTREADKLPALAGVATKVSELTGSSYFCGLWRETLIDNLCWIKPSSSDPLPSIYRAPTFSWASVDGYVGPNSLAGKLATCVHHITIIEAKAVIKTANGFGEVSDAFIVLEGHLLDATLSISDHDTVYITPNDLATRWSSTSFRWRMINDTALNATVTKNESGFHVNVLRARDRSSPVAGQVENAVEVPVKCLKVRTVKHDDRSGDMELLLLGKSENVSGAFERLGYLGSRYSNLYESLDFEMDKYDVAHPAIRYKVEAWLDARGMQKTRLTLV